MPYVYISGVHGLGSYTNYSILAEVDGVSSVKEIVKKYINIAKSDLQSMCYDVKDSSTGVIKEKLIDIANGDLKEHGYEEILPADEYIKRPYRLFRRDYKRMQESASG
jgi:hypothetical protein